MNFDTTNSIGIRNKLFEIQEEHEKIEVIVWGNELLSQSFINQASVSKLKN